MTRSPAEVMVELAERLRAAERTRDEKREAVESAQAALDDAEEAVADAKLKASSAAASGLVGRCFEWRFEDGSDRSRCAEMVISVDVDNGRAVSLKVSDEDEPSPFSPVIQLRSHALRDLFDGEFKIEITRESFELLYIRVSNKLAAALRALTHEAE